MNWSKLNAMGATACLCLAVVGCTPQTPDMTLPPPPVKYQVMVPEPLQQVTELMGRVSALRSAEIRPQVGGIVQQRLFEQGSLVKAGQPLFQINPAPFKTDVETATAALQRTEAALSRASIQAARLRPLVETEAISRQAYDDVESQRLQALAEAAQARAELARKQLDLKFATITAPISGRVDQAQVSEGALVSTTDANPLARIQQIDQVYVDVRQPAVSLDALQRAAEAGRKGGQSVKVQILGSSGEPSGLTGKMLFSGISVDEGTGDVLVRLLVDNPRHKLLPGMFVRARFVLADLPQALSIPQQAVARGKGATSVWVLTEQSKVQQVPVQVGELVGRRYVVQSGLKAGDKVIVEGLDRMKEGVEVTPLEQQASQGALGSSSTAAPAGSSD